MVYLHTQWWLTKSYDWLQKFRVPLDTWVVSPEPKSSSSLLTPSSFERQPGKCRIEVKTKLSHDRRLNNKNKYKNDLVWYPQGRSSHILVQKAQFRLFTTGIHFKLAYDKLNPTPLGYPTYILRWLQGVWRQWYQLGLSMISTFVCSSNTLFYIEQMKITSNVIG